MKPQTTLRFVLLLAATLFLTLTLLSCDTPQDTSGAASTMDTTAFTPEAALTTTSPAETTQPAPTVGNPSAIGFASTTENTLPELYILTDDGEAITSRDEYKGVKVSAKGTTDDATFGFESLTAEARCRGNYTYTNMDKKSFRLKFTEKINLFGQGYGPAKSWVLLANHCDQSFLRNHVAFTLGRMLDNISYCSSSSFVKLYINGTYQGIYQVAEQHQVQDYRVNIQEDPDKIDTDYLIERDHYASDSGEEGLHYFRINRTKYLVQSDYMTEEKCAFLQDYFQKAHDAIRGGNQIQINRYIDLDSFIDTFILQALVKNTDIGFSSFFMVKQAGGKIYFTCPWDFDNALGNDERLDGGSPEGLYVGEKTEMDQQHEWFYLMMNNKWFVERLIQRWNEVKQPLRDAANAEMNRILACFGDEIATNFEVWRIFGKRINQEPREVMRLKTYEAHVQYLIEWFGERYTYLDNLINSEEIYYQGGEESYGGGWWGGW